MNDKLDKDKRDYEKAARYEKDCDKAHDKAQRDYWKAYRKAYDARRACDKAWDKVYGNCKKGIR